MMEVAKTEVLPLLIEHSLIKNDKENMRWILELRNGDKDWSLPDFNRALAGVRAVPGMKETIFDDVLEVVANEGDNTGLILTMETVPNITRYCYADVPMSEHRFLSSRTHAQELMSNQFSLNIMSTVKEDRVLKLDVEPAEWQSVPKYYTLKKCFRYVDAADGIKIHYDIEMLRRTTTPSRTMKESNVAGAPVQYAFSMEVLSDDHAKNNEAYAAQVLAKVLRFAQAVLHEPAILTVKQREAVLAEYADLIRPAMDPRALRDQQARPFFLAPKPVTLERQHLATPGSGYGILSVLTGYTVTDKADGERTLLYVARDGQAYLINNNLDVIPTGLSGVPKTLLDGEFINAASVFAAFDIYFADGAPLMSEPLMPTRNQKLLEITDAKQWTRRRDQWAAATLTITAKRHIAAEGGEMYRACRTLLATAAERPYAMDGLIFTPAGLPVFGYYPNRPVKVFRSAKWGRVFKWKPPEQNTIDFLIEEDGQVQMRTDAGQVMTFRQFKLMTGYNALQQTVISPLEGLKMRYEQKVSQDEEYAARQFQPTPAFEADIGTALVPLRQGRAVSLDNDVLQGGQIVEFSYDNDPTKTVGVRWTPLRVRHDKTKVYRRTHAISGTANDFSTAMNIWRSIHNPVSRAMISGETGSSDEDIKNQTIEERLTPEDVYYDRQVPREHCLSLNMLNFHNHGIKKMLYMKTKGQSLLELCCGKAGDAPRWREAGYSFVLGVDISNDNIVNPGDGAYARMLRQYRSWNGGATKSSYLDIVFAAGDVAKPLRTGEAAVDDESKRILKAVYGPTGKDFMRYVTGRVPRGFDTVSCQFAIHYMMESEHMLDGFLKNVADNLRTGGHFIATFMDGDAVHGRLLPSGKVEGVKEDQVIWAILKGYDTFGKDNPYGKKISVYLEMTRQLIPEFLVSFDHLVAKAAEFNLALVDSARFDRYYSLPCKSG